VGLGLVASTGLEAEGYRLPLVAVGGLALAVLVGALLTAKGSGILVAVAGLGAAYVGGLALREDGSALDPQAPLHAAGLLVVAELALLSVELRGAATISGRFLVRRSALLGALVLLTIALGTAILVIAQVPVGGGVGWTAVGVVAAAAALMLLVRRAGHRSEAR